MKKTLICCILAISLSAFLAAQTAAPAVGNVRTIVSEDRDMVTISYDLARSSGVSAYNISVKISLDGEHINALALTGDVGPNIPPGYGKRIVWDVLKDVSELYGTLQVEVSATVNARDCIPMKTVPVYAGLGGVATSGLGLILSGLKMESDSKALYDIYKTNLNPGADVYNEQSREEHYKNANNKHKLGSWLTIGGGTVIAAGGAIMVARLLQISRYNKKCSGQNTAHSSMLKLEPIWVSGGAYPRPGIGLTIQF
jgi:hypothetical protein